MCLSISFYAATVENSIESSKNLELPYDPAIPLLGTYPKNMKTLIENDICTLMFITVFTTAKIWKQPKYPST